MHERGVLCENATRVARRKRFPAVSAGFELGVVDEYVECSSCDIDPYQITIAHEADGSAIYCLGCYVANTQSGCAA